MKFARLERLTGFTQLKWPTICSLMEAWAPLFEQGSGTCRRHHAARCSFGFCFKNRIWTADRLLGREWMNDYFCPFCIRNLETVKHLFVECHVARQLWVEISNWTSLPRLHPHTWDIRRGIADWYDNLTPLARTTRSKGTVSHYDSMLGNLGWLQR
jgi:hypothetical protein